MTGRPTWEGWLAVGKDAKSATVCLVSALTIVDFGEPELTIRGTGHIPRGSLGVLTLAAQLREKGHNPVVADLDQLFLDFLQGPRGRSEGQVGAASRIDLFRYFVDHLRSVSCDVIGFSSICSSYPLTLRLAAEIRKSNRNLPIIMGGPQASVVDASTMREFPCIDFVVRGEADHTLPNLLHLLFSGEAGISLESLPGITFRKGDNVVRNPNAPVISDLDSLPLPAFDLDPRMRERGSVYLEIGRGCPFACTFCSTNSFFGRKFRLKSPSRIIDHMKRVKQDYGLSNFSLVHDMYTTERKRVVEFCESLLSCGENFTWCCSARADRVDDELIALMAKAGCNGMFFGIESGSPRIQHVINKKLNLTEARKRIECADRCGVKTAVALIAGFPEETKDDLRDTIHFFVDSCRFDKVEPQLSLLAPLPATAILDQYKDRLVLDHIFSDISHQGWQQDPADLEMIASYPDVFPNFYGAPTTWLERRYFKEVRDFVTHVTAWFRWLPVALLQDSGDFLRVFEAWRDWLAETRVSSAVPGTGTTPYYCHLQFRKDFARFMRARYLESMAAEREVIAALVAVEELPGVEEHEPAAASPEDVGEIKYDSVPSRASNSPVVALKRDYKDLLEHLRSNQDPHGVAERDSTVAFLQAPEDQIQVWQLPPLSAALLKLCDGKRAVKEIIREFSSVDTSLDGVPLDATCLFGLNQLREEGFIHVVDPPAAAFQ